MSLDPLLLSKHEKYFSLCTQSFPSKAQSEDSNKLALIYFCLHGLDILGKLNLLQETRLEYVEVIFNHLIDTKDKTIQSFRPSQTFQLKEESSYDFPNLSATFFALSNLLALRSNYSTRLDNHKIMNFVKRCQVTEGDDAGSFKPVLDSNGQSFGETDLRHCYIAASIRKLVKYDALPVDQRKNDFDVNGLTNFIKKRINFNGGLSSNIFTESHSGLTFCGLATLKLLDENFAQRPENLDWIESTKSWLVHRQVDYPESLYTYNKQTEEYDDYEFYEHDDIGGFNGRENKFSDTCYCWWVTGSLSILNGLELFNFESSSRYLLNKTQNKLIGGFGKSIDVFPDPLHSYLALASLSLWKRLPNNKLNIVGYDKLDDIDEVLVITRKLRQFFDEVIDYSM